MCVQRCPINGAPGVRCEHGAEEQCGHGLHPVGEALHIGIQLLHHHALVGGRGIQDPQELHPPLLKLGLVQPPHHVAALHILQKDLALGDGLVQEFGVHKVVGPHHEGGGHEHVGVEVGEAGEAADEGEDGDGQGGRRGEEGRRK